MKTRAEAAALINRQLEDSPETSSDYPEGKTLVDGRAKGGKHHYGKQELRELLDFIYEGPPANADEQVA